MFKIQNNIIIANDLTKKANYTKALTHCDPTTLWHHPPQIRTQELGHNVPTKHKRQVRQATKKQHTYILII